MDSIAKWLRVSVILIAASSSFAAKSECLQDDPGDVKIRVQSKISDTFARACRARPQDIRFEYFDSWITPANELHVHQVIYLPGSAKAKRLCEQKLIAKLKSDASAGVGPQCSLFKSYKAAWFPKSSSGPSIMFYMKK